MENRMNLILVSSRDIVHTIFKLVCKKLNLKLTILEDIEDVVDSSEFVIADEQFIEQINSVRKYAKKTAIITNQDINITYSVNFKIPNPFLPITLIDILTKEIENIKEEEEITKYKNKKNEQEEEFRKNLLKDEETQKQEQAKEQKEELEDDLDNIYDIANDLSDENDDKYGEDENSENIEDLNAPIQTTQTMPKIVTPPQKTDLNIDIKPTNHQPISPKSTINHNDYNNIETPCFEPSNNNDATKNINIDFEEEDGYHEELNDIVAQVADQLNDDSKISIVEVDNARGGILNRKDLESISNIINSKEMSLNENELKAQEEHNNFSGLDSFDNSRKSEVGEDFLALSQIIDQAISDASSIDDVMEDKGFGSSNIVYLKDYDVNDLRPLLNRVNPMLIDSLKNEIPVKIELRLKRK
jgi:hypothetical protein